MKDICKCYSCGIEWERGINAKHSCVLNLAKRLKKIHELAKNGEIDKIKELSDINVPFGTIPQN